MTPWHLQPMVALDTETTGPNPDTARIVTATIIEVSSSGMGNVYEWLINPGITIPAGATAVHGVTTDKARADGVPPAIAIPEIAHHLDLHTRRGTPIVAFNAAYDLTVMDRECRRLDTPAPSADLVVDPHVIDKFMDRYRKGKRTLTAVCQHYSIDLRDAHTSTADALAAARLAWKLANQFPYLTAMSLPDLHTAQQGWRHEQAAGLQAHFRKTDPTALVNGDWPIQTLPQDWTPELVDPQEQDVAS